MILLDAEHRIVLEKADNRAAWLVKFFNGKTIGEVRYEKKIFKFVAPAKKGALVQRRSAKEWKNFVKVQLDLSDAIEAYPTMMSAKCSHCKKARGEHRAITFECPTGTKSRAVGYTSYGPGIFSPKQITAVDIIKAMDFKV